MSARTAIAHDEVATPDAPAHSLFGRDLLYMAAWSLQIVVSTIVSPILTHVLPAAEFGLLSTAIALHQVLMALAVLGLDQVVMVQRAQHAAGARGVLALALLVSSAFSLLFALTAPLWSGPFGFGDDRALVIAVILWTAPGAVVQVTMAFLVAEDRFAPFAVLSAVVAVGGPVGGLVLLFTVGDSARIYAWAGVGAQFVALAISLLVARPHLGALVDAKRMRGALVLGLPLAVGSLANFALTTGDRVIIQGFDGPVAAGRYQVAYVLGSVVILLLTVLGATWTARFAAMADVVGRVRLAATSRDELFAMLCPIVLGITLGAPVLLEVLAPATLAPRYLQIVVFLIVLSAFAVAASDTSRRLLLAEGRSSAIGIPVVIAAVANIGLNLVLVPRFGLSGAAFATLVSYLLLAVLQAVSLRRHVRVPPPSIRLILLIAGTVALAGATLILPASTPIDLIRFAVAAVGCVPWLLLLVLRARRRNAAPALEAAE